MNSSRVFFLGDFGQVSGMPSGVMQIQKINLFFQGIAFSKRFFYDMNTENMNFWSDERERVDKKIKSMLELTQNRTKKYQVVCQYI